jgi:hypothetical protein
MYISEIVIHVSGLCHRNGKLSLFHPQLKRMRQLVTFGKLSNDVDTTGKVQCVLWLAELQSLTAVKNHYFRTQYGHRKAFGSGTTN